MLSEFVWRFATVSWLLTNILRASKKLSEYLTNEIQEVQTRMSNNIKQRSCYNFRSFFSSDEPVRPSCSVISFNEWIMVCLTNLCCFNQLPILDTLYLYIRKRWRLGQLYTTIQFLRFFFPNMTINSIWYKFNFNSLEKGHIHSIFRLKPIL